MRFRLRNWNNEDNNVYNYFDGVANIKTSQILRHYSIKIVADFATILKQKSGVAIVAAPDSHYSNFLKSITVGCRGRILRG